MLSTTDELGHFSQHSFISCLFTGFLMIRSIKYLQHGLYDFPSPLICRTTWYSFLTVMVPQSCISKPCNCRNGLWTSTSPCEPSGSKLRAGSFHVCERHLDSPKIIPICQSHLLTKCSRGSQWFEYLPCWKEVSLREIYSVWSGRSSL